MCALISGIISTAVTQPADIIKTRIQVTKKKLKIKNNKDRIK